jgi:anti-anti-sigma factor
MQIDVERKGSVVVLSPVGDMDVTTLPDFEARLDALTAEGARAVLWDLHGVGILPSTALGFLLNARRRLAEVGGHMALARANRLVRSTLGTMGVLDVFPVFDTRRDALAHLQAKLAD